jgi:hypothetical protein
MRYMIPFFLILTLPTACPSDPAKGNDEGGASDPDLVQMPVPAGQSMFCTQGAGGVFSHRARSTLHAVDLDTPNDRKMEIYAPASGIAHVHADAPKINFGNHVNIDLGNGHFVLVGHMDTVFVKDGEAVVAGELLGYEGCSGDCSGDHVHLGLLKGDASQPAERGLSVPMTLSISADGKPTTIAGDAMQCGVPGGTSYVSASPVVMRHPDGALVKTGDDPRVYQLVHGASRSIADESAFRALGYDFRDVLVVSAAELGCYDAGATISSPADLDWTPVSGLTTGTFVREASASDVYAVAPHGLMPVRDWSTFLLLGGDPDRIRFVPDGTLLASGFPIGDCVGNVGCIAPESVTTCGGALTFGTADDGGQGGAGQTPDLGALLSLQDGQFGIAYAPPIAMDGLWVKMQADRAGAVVFPWAQVGFVSQAPDIAAVVDGLRPGDEVRYVVGMGDVAGVYRSCDDLGGQGDLLVRYGSQDLQGDIEAGFDPEGCVHRVTLPDANGQIPNGGNDGQEGNGNADPDAGPSASLPPDGGESDGTGQPGGSGDGAAAAATLRELHLSWTTPFSATASLITLSGEYRFADGSYGFTWHDLAQASDAASIAYDLSGVGSGDTLRFSAQFTDESGHVSWSCIAPFPPGTLQGSARADVDGLSVQIEPADDPASDGCGLFLTIP